MLSSIFEVDFNPLKNISVTSPGRTSNDNKRRQKTLPEAHDEQKTTDDMSAIDGSCIADKDHSMLKSDATESKEKLTKTWTFLYLMAKVANGGI